MWRSCAFSCASSLRSAARARSAASRASLRTPTVSRNRIFASRAAAVISCIATRCSAAALRCTATSARASSTCSSRDLEEHLGRTQLVVGPLLLADDDVLVLLDPGEVLGRVGLQERAEPRERRGLALVHVVDRVDHVVALRVEVGAPLDQLGLGALEPGLRLGQLGLHELIADPGCGELRLRLVQLRPRLLQVGLRRRELGGRLAVPVAGLLEGVVGLLDLLLDVLLSILEVVSVGERDGHCADRQRASRGCGDQATASGTGEETHR